MKNKNKAAAVAYLGIIFVVLIWGLSPSAKKALGLCASFMSSGGDILERKREVKK